MLSAMVLTIFIGESMDAALSRFKKEIRESQRAAAVTAEAAAASTKKAAEAAVGLVRKQEEMDVFVEHYNKRLKADLEEMEAEDEQERFADEVSGVVPSSDDAEILAWFAQADDASLGFDAGNLQ